MDLVSVAAAAATAAVGTVIVVTAGKESGTAIVVSAVVSAVTVAATVVEEEIVAMMAGLRDVTETFSMTAGATDGATGIEVAETEMRTYLRKTDAAVARPPRRRNASLLPISPTSCRSLSASVA